MDRAVVVAVALMGMVKVTVHQIIDVVSVRYRLVPAFRSVLVIGLVVGTRVVRRAIGRVGRVDLKAVLVNVVSVRVVQVTVVKVVHVIFMTNSGVSAAVSVCVRMVVMLAAGHGVSPLGVH